MFKSYISSFIIIALGGMLATGCKKALEIDAPSNERDASTIFKSDKTAIPALSGLYSSFTQSSTQVSVVTLNSALLSDELGYLGASLTYDDYINNNLDPVITTSLQSVFSDYYAAIYKANSIIEGLTNNVGTTAAVKKRLIGESKFIRAYCYFYLVNYFGEVPLVLVTDPAISAFLPRAAVSTVYQQIITDLTNARDSLAGDYSAASSGDRFIANKYTSAALLARAYLYSGNYAAAEENASMVIDATSLYTLVPKANIAKGVFVKNSSEVILQFPAYLGVANSYTFEGATFIPATYTAANITFSIRPGYWSKFSSGDLRASQWVKDTTIAGVAYHVPLKYKYRTNALAVAAGVTECPVILRLSEQYLIRAEARARLNKAGALDDYNMVHTRAGLTAGTYTDPAVLLNEIEEENAREFFCELGHRWFYLRHTGKIDAVMNAIKTTWASTDALLPIPQTARDANVNLTQNLGYKQ